jgi:hypothetical protein
VNKADRASDRRVLEFLDVLHDSNQDRAVLFLRSFQLFDFVGQGLVAGQHFAQLDESANNEEYSSARRESMVTPCPVKA